MLVVDRGLPASRKKRGVGSEKQSIRSRDREERFKHLMQGETWKEADPSVRARSIEVDVRIQAGQHQCLLHESRSEMGDQYRQTWKGGCRPLQVERIPQPDVERAGES